MSNATMLAMRGARMSRVSLWAHKLKMLALIELIFCKMKVLCLRLSSDEKTEDETQYFHTQHVKIYRHHKVNLILMF